MPEEHGFVEIELLDQCRDIVGHEFKPEIHFRGYRFPVTSFIEHNNIEIMLQFFCNRCPAQSIIINSMEHDHRWFIATGAIIMKANPVRIDGTFGPSI